MRKSERFSIFYDAYQEGKWFQNFWDPAFPFAHHGGGKNRPTHDRKYEKTNCRCSLEYFFESRLFGTTSIQQQSSLFGDDHAYSPAE